ncbi:MAG TPA: phenylalanine--tRNA ligase subunit beta, partial [Epsilonproteobacteria bacterium]|nr:phenylalanine--tRNA ligase subunit beta [Campylobacterota bacterium]
MIVTRSWLSEFIDLGDVTNETLYKTFNAIGLEVDSINEITIPEKVVVGKVLSCEKHPDADKLNVCRIDVGSGTRQIVCGAANVVNAEYVAVATIGAVLPGDFEIKHAKLRGVESEGMVCSAKELGLPEIGDGIMILDESIGSLEAGKALSSYPTVSDTIIELELTANRGDCLSIFGVARDLSVALDKELKHFEYKQDEKMKLGIAREAEMHQEGEMDADLHYKLANIDTLQESFLITLRLAMVDASNESKLQSLLAYATHTTGVILRAFDSTFFKQEEKIVLKVKELQKGIIELLGNGTVQATVGVNQSDDSTAGDTAQQVIFEASYIHPDLMVEAISEKNYTTDDLYYKSSRGSNPELDFGLKYLSMILERYQDISCFEGRLRIDVDRTQETIPVNTQEVVDIIGMEVDKTRIVTILQKLGFQVSSR